MRILRIRCSRLCSALSQGYPSFLSMKLTLGLDRSLSSNCIRHTYSSTLFSVKRRGIISSPLGLSVSFNRRSSALTFAAERYFAENILPVFSPISVGEHIFTMSSSLVIHLLFAEIAKI